MVLPRRGAYERRAALRALAAANAAGVAVILDGDGLILDPMPAADLVAELKAAKPDLLRVLSGRVAARAVINTATPPPDCSEPRWVVARRGLKRFLDEGLGRPVDAARLDVGRAFRRPARLGPRRSVRRRAPHRRSPRRGGH